MKEDLLNTLRQQDAALREAIRMEEQELPQMPDDLNARVMGKKTLPRPLPVREGSGHPVVRRIWPWVAAAATLLLLIGVGLTMMYEEQKQPGEPVVAKKVEQKKPEVQRVETEPRAEEKATVWEKCSHGTDSQLAQGGQRTRTGRTYRKPEQGSEEAPKEAVVTETSVQSETKLTQAEGVEHGDNSHQLAANGKPETLTERDIPITRPENYKYTPEEIALMKKQAAEAYLKWVELELEIAKHNMEQTAQQ